jgi:phospholipase/carboxylesterase
MKLSGPAIEPKQISSAVILLHGLGANGANLIDIGKFLSKDFPNTAFISPNAPFELDMMPGMNAYQWFSLSNWSPKAMLDGANQAAPILNEFIDEVLAKYNLADNKLALVGFSQGTMMSLHVALRRSKALAGVIGFSGALIAPELLEKETKSKPDICLVHGAMDMVVPYPAMHMAESALTNNGLKVTTHTRPYLDHSIDMEGIEIAGKFLEGRI